MGDARQTSPLNTFELFQRMVSGDSSAERELVGRLDAMLRQAASCHALRAHLPRHMDLDDVVNEVWRSVLAGKSLEEFDDERDGALRAFMLTALDRRMIDAARRAAHQAEHVGAADGASADPPDLATPSITSQARASELLGLVERSMGERDALLIRGAAKGRTARELAQQLALSEDAAQRALTRARARARRLFAEI